MSADIRNDSRETPGHVSATAGAGTTRQQRVGILRNPNRAPMPPPRRATLTGKWFNLRSSRRAAPGIVDSAAQAVASETRPSDGAAGAATPPRATDTAPTALPMKPVRGDAAERVKPARAASPRAKGHATPEKTSARVDIAQLTEAVADLGEKKSRRRRYGEVVAPTGAPPGSAADAKAPTRPDGHSADDDEMQGAASARRIEARAKNALPPLADALDDHEDEIVAHEPEQSTPAGRSIGARVLRGVLLCCLAALAIAAMITLPRA